MTVDEVLEKALALSVDERKELAKRLIDTLGKVDTEKTHSILEFKGVGAHTADAEDPQAYVNRLRNEWDERS